MLFHSVIGEDMREERSPSFFNTSEVSVVLNYVEELLQARKGGMKLKPEDIGIISPYRKQVCYSSKMGRMKWAAGGRENLLIKSDTNKAVKPQKLGRGFQFWTYNRNAICSQKEANQQIHCSPLL